MTSLIECPVTPDRIDQCPATPELLPIKSPSSTSASSDNDDNNNNDPTRSTSPPPNCAICLGKCKNKCFTDSCLHQFCFKCLLEWSKVKAECPLCKQSFKSIIHNVKSIDQFEEYLVQQPIQIENFYPNTRILQYHSHHSTTGQRNNNRGFSATVEIHNTNMDLINRAEVLDRFRQRFPENLVSNSSLSQVWRRYIYDRHLYALPLPDVTGRFRECSARFYRENPAQVHRIMPWLNRDLVTLLRNTDQHVSLLLSTIGDLITIFNISSAEFRRRVTPYFGNNTSHFIHELLNFARSPFDMIGYDRAVQYTQYYEAIIVSTSSDDSDSEVVSISQVAGRIFSRRLGRSSLGFTIETSERDSTLRICLGNGNNNTNNASTSQTTAINLTTNNNNNSNGNNNNNGMLAGTSSSSSTSANINTNIFLGQPQVLGETQVIDIEQNSGVGSSGNIMNELGTTNIALPINTVSSSSDECEFVLEQKPPHLRTPELVSLNSDSDSDVVFVSELKVPQVQNNQTTGIARYKKDLQKGIFLPSSPINNYSSDSDIRFDTAQLNNYNNNINKIPRLTSNNEQVQPNLKSEYNHGASTSSGLKNRSIINKTNTNIPIPSTSKLRRPRKNSLDKKNQSQQQQPIRTMLRRRGDRNVKTIYESSSSSDDNNDWWNKDDSEKTNSSNNSDLMNTSYWNINNKKIKDNNNSQIKSRRRHINEKILNMKKTLQKKRHSIKRKRHNNDNDDDTDYEKDEKERSTKSSSSWKKLNKLQNKQNQKSKTKSTINKSKKRKHNYTSSSTSTSSTSSSSDSELSKSASTSSSSSSSSSSSDSNSTDFSDSDMEPLIKIGRYNKKTQTIPATTPNLTNSSSSVSSTATVSSSSATVSSSTTNSSITTLSTNFTNNPITTTIEPPLIFSNRRTASECSNFRNDDDDDKSNNDDDEYNFTLSSIDSFYNCENPKENQSEYPFNLDNVDNYYIETNVNVDNHSANLITESNATQTLHTQPENE